MGLTIEEVKPFLEEPEYAVDRVLVGRYRVQRVGGGLASDGRRIVKLECSDITGTVTVLAWADDWSRVPHSRGQHSDVVFEFVPDQNERTHPVARPAPDAMRTERRSLELLPAGRAPNPEDVYRLAQLVDSLKVPAYRTFLDACFADPEFAWLFVTLPAFRGGDYPEQGGFLAHSLEVANGVGALAENFESYVMVREAATIVGLLHDVSEVVLASSEKHFIPFGARTRRLPMSSAFSGAVERMRDVDEEAYGVFRVIADAYDEGEYFLVPLAGAVRAVDRLSI